MCNFICERCLANRLLQCGNPWNFFTGGWLDMIIDHDMYMRTTPNLLKSPWACVPNWTLTRCLDDLLHLMWLGFGKDLIGQVLFERAMTEYPSLEEGLTGLWRECKLWHKSKKHRSITKDGPRQPSVTRLPTISQSSRRRRKL